MQTVRAYHCGMPGQFAILPDMKTLLYLRDFPDQRPVIALLIQAIAAFIVLAGILVTELYPW